MVDNGGIITLESIEELIRMRERDLYLQQHRGKRWQGSNGKWYTYLGSGEDRKLVKRSTEEDLIEAISSYYKGNDGPTVYEVFEEWISHKLLTGEITKGTRDRYVIDYKHYIFSLPFNNLRIKQVVEDDIDELLETVMSENSFTAKGFSNFRIVVKGIFKYAKRKHWTNINISAYFQDIDISKKAFRSVPKDMKNGVFHTDEIPKLTKWLLEHPTVENLGLIFSFQTGIRVGELAALKFSDIDNGVLHVQRQEIVYESELKGKNVYEVVEYTKTEAGNRYVYLPESSSDVIMLLYLNRTSEYVMSRDGERIHKVMFNRYLKRACEGCGITPRSMHKIRRTYATMLIDSGVEDSLTAEQLGHTSIETTRNYYYYANKNQEHNKRQIERAIDIFGNQG